MREKIPFEITEKIATLAEFTEGAFALELNLVSYKGAPAKYDLRKWDKRQAEPLPLKGITLTQAEAEAAAAAIQRHIAAARRR